MSIALYYALVCAAITYACLDASERLRDGLTNALRSQDEQDGPLFGDLPALHRDFLSFHAGDIARD